MRDRVVALYQAGIKLDDITEQTGVHRGTIYTVLQERGITPSRQRRSARPDPVGGLFQAEGIASVPVDELVRVAADLRLEVGRLQERFRLLEVLVGMMIERQRLLDPDAAEQWERLSYAFFHTTD